MKNSSEKLQLVRKSNSLVEGRYKMGIWEMRVFTEMITRVQRDDADFKVYRVYMQDVIKTFDLKKDHSAYDKMRAGAQELMKKIVTIIRRGEDGRMKEFQTPIVAGIEKDIESVKRPYLDLTFHPKLKPFLLQLKEQFTYYDIRQIKQLKSVYSIRIYELLKQYQSIGKRKMTIEEMRNIFSLDKNTLKSYGHFKKRVIERAQQDLSAFCDIKFEFNEIKKSRKVIAIEFIILPNQEEKPPVAIPRSTSKLAQAYHARTKAILLNNSSLERKLIEQMGAKRFANEVLLTKEVMKIFPEKYQNLSKESNAMSAGSSQVRPPQPAKGSPEQVDKELNKLLNKITTDGKKQSFKERERAYYEKLKRRK